MVFLQLLGFFALVFVLVSLGACAPLMSAAGGAAFALGFFLQYIFDINAWSELAGCP